MYYTNRKHTFIVISKYFYIRCRCLHVIECSSHSVMQWAIHEAKVKASFYVAPCHADLRHTHIIKHTRNFWVVPKNSKTQFWNWDTSEFLEEFLVFNLLVLLPSIKAEIIDRHEHNQTTSRTLLQMRTNLFWWCNTKASDYTRVWHITRFNWGSGFSWKLMCYNTIQAEFDTTLISWPIIPSSISQSSEIHNRQHEALFADLEHTCIFSLR